MRPNDQDIEEVIASDLLGGDILHAHESTSPVLPTDEIQVLDGGISDASGTVALGGSSDVGGTGDVQASADVGATTGAGALGPSPTEE
jgi:hypothetical protein